MLMMPRLDGFEVCRGIRADPATAHILIVLVTALSAADDRVRGFEAGADDYFTKPVDGPALMARIPSLLRQKRYYEGILRDRLPMMAATRAHGWVSPEEHAHTVACWRTDLNLMNNVAQLVKIIFDDEQQWPALLHRAHAAPNPMIKSRQ